MGSDLGPSELIAGAVSACSENRIQVALIGDEELIRSELTQIDGVAEELLSVTHASEWIAMDENPARAVLEKRNSSIRVAFEAVRTGQASSIVGAGNTGAFLAAGVTVLGVLPGIDRPGIASLIPRFAAEAPAVLIDTGANADCRPENLVQFAHLGAWFSHEALGIASPRVALLSNGRERVKGNATVRAAYGDLGSVSELNFVGYLEGNEIASSRADVIVCDGFSGNVALKSMEGAVQLVWDMLDSETHSFGLKSFLARLGLPWIRRAVTKRLDAGSYGGAPLLGLCGNAVVCHGSSDRRAIGNAVKYAHTLCLSGMSPFSVEKRAVGG